MPPGTTREAFERWYKSNEELLAIADRRYLAWCAWRAHSDWGGGAIGGGGAVTVAELIAKWRELPQGARVVIDGYEGGVEDVAQVTMAPILVNVRDIADTMYGNHELCSESSERPADEIAVYLPRRVWP
jgi:hypothetical protein